jgi:hypothetical protein
VRNCSCVLLVKHASGTDRKTAQSGGYGERLHFCRIGPKPIPPCSPSRLVALSRCPDATYILTALASGDNGTKVWRVTNRRVYSAVQPKTGQLKDAR